MKEASLTKLTISKRDYCTLKKKVQPIWIPCSFRVQNFSRGGFSLVEMGIVLLLISVVGLVSATVNHLVQKQNSDGRLMQATSDIKRTVLHVLENEDNFKRTLAHADNAAAFACLNSGGDCNGATGTIDLVSFDPVSGTDSKLDYTSSAATRGFNARGEICNTFTLAGNDDCPYKYNVTWAAYCPGNHNINGAASAEARCFNPLVEIRAQLQFAPANPAKFPIFNSSKQSIRIVKAQSKSEVVTLCGMVNGGAVVGSNCVLPALSTPLSCAGTCAVNVQPLVVGFNTDGSPKCECAAAVSPIAATSCNTPAAPFGRVLLGINADGSLICGDGLLPRIVAAGSLGNPAAPFSGGY